MKIKEMTPEQKVIAIAEKCGWKNIYTYTDNQGPDLLCGDPPFILNANWEVIHQFSKTIPDYLNDLNVIVKDIKDYYKDTQQMRRYVDFLVCEMKPGEFAVNATAQQRADAFLLELGVAEL